MRVLSSMILCLFMALCVLANDDSANDNSASDDVANDFVLGERKEGDHLDSKRFYFRHSHSTPVVKIFATARRKNEVVTQVKLRNVRSGELPTVTVLEGQIGKRALVLRAEAKPGETLALFVEVYAAPAPSATTPSPTTPSPTTVADASNDDASNNDASNNDASNNNDETNVDETNDD